MLDSALLDRIRPFTMCPLDRLETLASICQYLNATQIPGDFVECGTYKGGSAALISVYLESRHLWLYDSFAGMPETTTIDGEDAKQWIGECRAAIEDVHEVMHRVGTSEARYTIRKGWFETTFQEPLPQQVALLHCDADWYESVTLVLETFYPLMPIGGCVVLDDFGCWEGCREAFYDFCQRHREKPLLERVSTDQAFWIKGRLHNRAPIPEFNHSGNRLFTELSALEKELQAAIIELEQSQTKITAMKSSKFWKLRSRWLQLKHLIQDR